MSELEKLLAPVTPETFLRRHWEKAPLHVRGKPRKFDGLFDMARFQALAGQARHLHAQFPGGRKLAARPEDIDTLYRAGGTICMTDIAEGDPVLARFVAAVKSQLRFAGTVDVRAYLSNDGCGFDLHYDARIATTLQISGKKRWRFSRRPAVPFPVVQVALLPDGRLLYDNDNQPVSPWERVTVPPEDEIEEVVLEAGDVLCLPAGTWHAAKAVGHSLAINLAFSPVRFWDVLTKAIEPRLRESPEWRHSPPPVLGDDSGSLPPEVARFVRARLREVRALLDNLSVDDPRMADAWRSLVYGRVRPDDPSPVSAAPLRKDTWLSVSRPIGFGPCLDADGAPAVALYHGRNGAQVKLPASAAPFARRLVRSRRLCAGDAAEWPGLRGQHDWNEVRELFDDLVRLGFLERESRPRLSRARRR